MSDDEEYCLCPICGAEHGFENPIIPELREQNAKLQAAISDMLTCNFTGEKCPECYGKARLLIAKGDKTC